MNSASKVTCYSLDGWVLKPVNPPFHW